VETKRLLGIVTLLAPVPASASAEESDHFSVRQGTQTSLLEHDFSPTEDRLVETARHIREMGSGASNG
jgi:hypothetical protein